MRHSGSTRPRHPAADDLRNSEYISLGMMLKLAENEVLSLDDLADLDSDEFVALLSEHGLEDDTEAGDIIKAARAHWFDDEPEAARHPMLRVMRPPKRSRSSLRRRAGGELRAMVGAPHDGSNLHPVRAAPAA